jgi:hypothetical protein
MVTQYETGGPKNQLPYVYGPEDDVYPMAWAGEIVLIADKGYSWDNRPTYSCHDAMNFDMKILYEDQLLFLVPNSADTTLPYNESLSGTKITSLAVGSYALREGIIFRLVSAEPDQFIPGIIWGCRFFKDTTGTYALATDPYVQAEIQYFMGSDLTPCDYAGRTA